MQKHVIRRTGTTLAAMTVMVAAAACQSGSEGGSGGSDRGSGEKGAGERGTAAVSPISALRGIARKTGEQKTAKVEGTSAMGTAVALSMEGAIGWADGGVTGTVRMRYTGGTMAENMRKAGVEGAFETRYLRDAYYVNMGDAVTRQTGGRPWIRYAYADMAKIMGAAGDAVKDQMQNNTPDKGVKSLLASGDVKKVGEEEVRGVSATHYSGTVDVADLAKKNTGLDAARLEELQEQLTKAGITTQKIDIWVDGNDLLVKKVESGQMKTGTFNSTVYYSDYGTDASVQAPPASQSADFADLLGKR
ncbi:hypothetical protein [Streptomyces sp. NPDC050504]|uniref:hypothetical protein n=1 Tax=Streptomyces sp. NPDC050504 TaxID=3365618 RepID=UPI003791BD45